MTSSAFSDTAAEDVTILSPTLFSGDIEQRLDFVCDLLYSRRDEKLATSVKIPAGTSDSMSEILQEAAHEKIKSSFQTTMVAAQFEPQADAIKASVVRCGDSMFVALDPKSEPLWCSPQSFGPAEPAPTQDGGRWRSTTEFAFGPGDEVLVTIDPSLAQDPFWARRMQIAPGHGAGFYVCRVLEKCQPTASHTATDPVAAWVLRYGDRIVVPKYLMGRVTKAGGCFCAVVRYSRMIRSARGSSTPPRLCRGGAVTAVLPDHFHSGQWSYFDDAFPSDSQFVLCSDGFYGCFDDMSEMASWLKEHRQVILDPDKRTTILTELHGQLRQRGHDDDISFVWIFPPDKSGGASKKNENPNEGA